MPKWIPEDVWRGQEVFIIGGGSSLKKFDWNLLKSKLTIGCNDAYTLGEEICKICVFGDNKWFRIHSQKLASYKGTIFTNTPQLLNTKIPWIWTMPRITTGFHTNALGWNGNTGAVAINLALILGAKKIFLLGFDMFVDKEGNSNWHSNQINKKQKQGIYQKFLSHTKRMAFDLAEKFPGVDVVNVTDKSNLNIFPKIGAEAFWKERKE